MYKQQYRVFYDFDLVYVLHDNFDLNLLQCGDVWSLKLSWSLIVVEKQLFNHYRDWVSFDLAELSFLWYRFIYCNMLFLMGYNESKRYCIGRLIIFILLYQYWAQLRDFSVLIKIQNLEMGAKFSRIKF